MTDKWEKGDDRTVYHIVLSAFTGSVYVSFVFSAGGESFALDFSASWSSLKSALGDVTTSMFTGLRASVRLLKSNTLSRTLSSASGFLMHWYQTKNTTKMARMAAPTTPPTTPAIMAVLSLDWDGAVVVTGAAGDRE